MPRFVVLEHDHPALHWDLMLESSAALRTWRLASPPQPGRVVPAEASFDHRPAYLDYEGPVSGGRGRVKRWDCGTFELEEETPCRLTIRFAGECLRGRAVLEQSANRSWVFRQDQETAF